MDQFKVIAFTHASVGLEKVAQLYIAEDDYADLFPVVKEELGLSEFVFLATCNRVEFYFRTEADITNAFLRAFFTGLYPHFSSDQIHWAVETTEVVDGLNAVRHMFHVASSLDSMVVGEREILTQFRKSFAKARDLGLTGDFMRLAERKTIENAKQVFTETNIANRPVSIVNLANRELRNSFLPLDARILVIGAGVTNTAMLRKLKKQGYTNFAVFNRTLEKAEALVNEVGGRAFALDTLATYTEGFDALLTCTGASHAIVDTDVYGKLVQGETERKLVIDLAVPTDMDPQVIADFNIEYVEVGGLREIADQNLEARKKELVHCEQIVDKSLEEFKKLFHERQVELAMRSVPVKVKEIRERAITEVFARDLQSLDEESRELLNSILSYMEKKYISVPMKMAKEILQEGIKPTE